MNPKMVERTPHPGPLPIGSADSAEAEREKRTQRLGKIVRRMVHGFMREGFGGFFARTLSHRPTGAQGRRGQSLRPHLT